MNPGESGQYHRMSIGGLDEAIRRLERTLVNEGGSVWRNAIFGGEAAEVQWPADLPPLTAELKIWFAWQSKNDDKSWSESWRPAWASWRSTEWAVEQYRRYVAAPNHRGSLVPVIEYHLVNHFVDVEDGSLWKHDYDEDGRDRFVCASIADLSLLLASMESEYAALRHSPWRNFRVDRGDSPPWTRLPAPPEVAMLARMPIGAALLATPASGRYPKGLFLLKLGPAKWLEMPSRTIVPFADPCIDDVLTSLRYSFGEGKDALKADFTDEAIAERLASMIKSWNAKGPIELHGGGVRVWQQPLMLELLARLDRELTRVAPHVRRALAPPARDADMAALEADIGAPLPLALRSLWAFADGQTTSDSFYLRYRLVSVANARSTLTGMLGLAADQFGEAYWDRALVPLLDRGNGDHLCVDIAGAYGPKGCIVDFDHERPERRLILFDSVTEWIECFVDGLEAGIYVTDPDEGIFPRGFLAGDSLDEINRHNEVRTNGRYPWERPIRMRPGSRSSS